LCNDKIGAGKEKSLYDHDKYALEIVMMRYFLAAMFDWLGEPCLRLAIFELDAMCYIACGKSPGADLLRLSRKHGFFDIRRIHWHYILCSQINLNSL